MVLKRKSEPFSIAIKHPSQTDAIVILQWNRISGQIMTQEKECEVPSLIEV